MFGAQLYVPYPAVLSVVPMTMKNDEKLTNWLVDTPRSNFLQAPCQIIMRTLSHETRAIIFLDGDDVEMLITEGLNTWNSTVDMSSQ